MHGMRFVVLSCALALAAIGCGSEEPSATEATEPEVSSTSGAEAEPVAEAPAPAPEPAPAAPPEPAPPAAAPPTPAPAPPTSSAIVVHKVKDFAAWKTGFDAGEQARKDAGILGHALMTDVAKPGVVALWLPTNDLAKAEAFSASPDLKKAMKDAGVIGKPTVTLLKHVDMSAPTGTPAKFGAIMDHKVKDFAAWKTTFDAHAQTRTDGGVTGYSVSQDPKDPNHVTVWLEAADKDTLTAFLAGKDLAAKMKEAGVKGKPKTTVTEIVEMKMYQ